MFNTKVFKQALKQTKLVDFVFVSLMCITLWFSVLIYCVKCVFLFVLSFYFNEFTLQAENRLFKKPYPMGRIIH